VLYIQETHRNDLELQKNQQTEKGRAERKAEKYRHISNRYAATTIGMNQRHFRSPYGNGRSPYRNSYWRTAIGMQVHSAARRRIKERTIVRQERQRKVFYILFTIFTTVYTIILAFIGATFKFIETMAIVLVKGLLGILGPFYNNSKDAKRGEESKQPIKPRVSPKLGDAIPTPTPITLGTDNS